MAKEIKKKFSLEFGKKEKVLNYACQTYQLSRPSKVGTVMALIRDCQPSNFEEWEKWYFEKAFTDTKNPLKITKEILEELGERLYTKIKDVVIPEWTEAFNQLTLQDCIDYLGFVNEYAFGIQIKPVTSKANFGNYSPSERMKASFDDFTEKYGGKVFLVYSIDDKIKNEDVVNDIAFEIERLKKEWFFSNI